jgi:hypothetical protein
MGPEGSFPHSQEPPASLYPEPGQSSPCPANSTSWRSILILSTHVRLGRPSGLLTSGLHHENPVYTSPHTCYMPCPSPSFDQPNNIWCGASRYAVFSIPLLPRPSEAQISSSALCKDATIDCKDVKETDLLQNGIVNTVLTFLVLELTV